MKIKIADVVVPSKKSVNRAGDVLIGLTPSTEDEKAMAQKIFDNWRSLHDYPINTFQATFRMKLAKLNLKNTLLAQRLKRTPSIVEKLKRPGENRTRLARMQDIAGIRIVVPKIQDIYTIIDDYTKSLNSSNFPHKSINAFNYINEPKLDGYRSFHQVFEFVTKSNSSLSSLKIELQIRTQLQHQWATAVEVLGLARETSYKSGQGDEKHKEFLSICSNLFAIKEGTPIHSKYHTFSELELCQKLNELNEELKIIDSLKAMRVASNRIIEDKINKGTKAYLHLILLNLDEKRLRITEYKQSDSEQAKQRYAFLENKIYSESLNWDVVLVSVDNIDKLKKAFPNYYLDTNEFIRSVQKYIAKCQ